MNFVAKAKSGVRGGNGLSAHRGLWADGPNLAHTFAETIGGVEAARESYEHCCIDFAGDLESFLGKGRLAYFETPFNSEWRYHCALEVDGIVHDLWQEHPIPLAKFMRVIGSDEVSYPAEEEEAKRTIAPVVKAVHQPVPAVAVIAVRRFREETFYSARVLVGGRKALSVEDGPSKQGVCLQVLEWSQRHGKSLVWNYL